MRLVFTVVILVAMLGSSAAIAAPLRVIGQARSAGDFAVAAASGDKDNAHALYLRGFGRKLTGLGVVACSRSSSIGSKSTRLRRMIAGRLYRLRMPFAGDCTVTASLSGRGRIRLQLLAR